MTSSFGQIIEVDIRSIWKNEQHDFTPWLAQPENLARLGKAIGFELETENIEVAVGPYSADILAKDVGTGRYVVIENQFGKTNHDHLGKLITYASILDATTVIWITETFTEEHQKALEWLNDHTTDDLSFYGVVLELFRVDNSLPAIRFNVVSRPIDIVRQAAIAKGAETLTDAQKIQFEFWKEFRRRLLDTKIVPTAQAARPQYWFDVPLGRAGITLSNTANTYENKIGVRVYISNKIASIALKQLLQERAAIERELGETLLWDPNPDARDKIIAIYREIDFFDKDSCSKACDWLVDMNSRFRKVFMPRVKKLILVESSMPVGESS